jgi:hypothetical protein
MAATGSTAKIGRGGFHQQLRELAGAGTQLDGRRTGA